MIFSHFLSLIYFKMPSKLTNLDNIPIILSIKANFSFHIIIIFLKIQMELRTFILLKVLIPSIVVPIILIAITMGIVNLKLSDWISGFETVLSDAEIQILEEGLNNTQSIVQSTFTQFMNDLQITQNFYKKVLDYKTNPAYYKTYYALKSIDPTYPTSPLEASVYYSPIVNNSIYMNSSSVLDDAFRMIYKAGNNYSSIYVGFIDNAFRIYPYAPKENYPSLRYTCAKNMSVVTGFQVDCREWYQLAIRNPGSFVFTAPYISASTNKITITVAKTFENQSQTIGVFGLDASMESVDEILKKNKILNSGYYFIIDENYRLIFYPNLDRSKIHSLSEMENIKTLGTKKNFEYVKNSESWYFTYTKVAGLPYYLCATVPISEISRTKYEMTGKANDVLSNAIKIAAVCYCLLAVIGIFLSKITAARIMKSFLSILDFLKKIANGQDPEELVGGNHDDPEEVKRLRGNLNELGTALRSAKWFYYSQNYEKALEIYERFENMMKLRGNQRALAIIYSNKANVLRKLPQGANQPDKAKQAYLHSLQFSRNLIATNQAMTKPLYNETLLKGDLGKRLSNYGIFLMERGEYEQASQSFEESVREFGDDSEGISKVIRWHVQTLIALRKNEDAMNLVNSNIQDAERTLETAIAESDENKKLEAQRCLHYSYMNKGIVLLKLKNKKESAKFFSKALDISKYWEVDVAAICALKLRDHFADLGKMDKANQIENSFQGILCKNVKFVLDCSGSMLHTLEICKRCIKDVIETLEGNDTVSLYVFNTLVIPIFENFKVRNQKSDILKILGSDKRIKAQGGTAFYSALEITFQASGNPNDWVVALTDGEDTDSKINPDQLVSFYRAKITNTVMITCGQLKNENEIKKICQASSRNFYQGVHLTTSQAPNQDGLRSVFQNVTRFLKKGDPTMEDML